MVAVEVSLPDPQLPDQAATGERIVHEPVPCDGFRIKVGILQCTIGGTRAMAGHRITIKLMNFQCKRDISAMQPLNLAFINLMSAPVSAQYAAQVAAGKIEHDDAQQAIVDRLAQLEKEVAERRLARKSSSLGWLFGSREAETIKGLYIFGDVGR